MADDFQLSCLLFDLDGTLLDTAPDLIAALNFALTLEGLPTVAYNVIRPYISFGAAVMIEQSVNNSANKATQDRLLEQMLDRYQANIAIKTEFFAGIAATLELLESKQIKWGVITNKRKRFSEPLMQALDLTRRTACLVSGDSTGNSKPHPEPMYFACKLADVKPDQCIYIGDSAHDIQAGNLAGMKTLAATYGYLKVDDCPNNWGASDLITTPTDLKPWLLNSSYLS